MGRPLIFGGLVYASTILGLVVGLGGEIFWRSDVQVASSAVSLGRWGGSMKTSLLITDDYPIVVPRGLAARIGLCEALIIQTIFWLQGKGSGKMIEGDRWVYNTYFQWRKEFFPFWSERTIQRYFMCLEESGLLMSKSFFEEHGTIKYYRVGDGAVSKLNTEDFPMPKIEKIGATKSKNSLPHPHDKLSCIPTTSCHVSPRQTGMSIQRVTDIESKPESLKENLTKESNLESPTKDNQSSWVEIKEEELIESPKYEPTQSAQPIQKTDAPKNEVQPSTPAPRRPVSDAPPKWADVRDYCKAMTYHHVDPYAFVEYYTKTEWRDKVGRPVKDWKGKCRTWNEYAIKEGKDPCWFEGAWPVPPPGNIDRDPHDLYRWNLFKRDFDLAKKKKNEDDAFQRRMGLK